MSGRSWVGILTYHGLISLGNIFIIYFLLVVLVSVTITRCGLRKGTCTCLSGHFGQKKAHSHSIMSPSLPDYGCMRCKNTEQNSRVLAHGLKSIIYQNKNIPKSIKKVPWHGLFKQFIKKRQTFVEHS